MCLVFTAVDPAEYEDVYDGSNDTTSPDIEKIPFLHNADPVKITWIVVALSMMADGRYRTMFRSMTLSSSWARRGFKLISELLLIAAVVVRFAMEAPLQYDDKDTAGQLYQRCHVIFITCRLARRTSAPIYDFLSTLRRLILMISFLTIVAAYETLPFLSQMYKPLGVLYLIFKALLYDVFIWSLLFIIITVSFCLTLVGMQKAGYYITEDGVSGGLNKGGFNDGGPITGADGEPLSRDELMELSDPFHANGAMWAPWWAIFGDPSPERYSWLASILIWVYCLVGNIVLVNMLIAMFADTYTKIASQSEIEYFFLRSTHLYEYQSSAVLSVPPVLNLPLILMAVLRRIGGWKPSDTLTMIALAARSDSLNERRSSGRGHNSSDSLYEKSARNGAEKKGRSQAGMPTLDFDGKLLVDRYLRKVIEQERDTVHVLARSTNVELEKGLQRCEAATRKLGVRLGGIGDKLDKLAAAYNRTALESNAAFESKASTLPGPSNLPAKDVSNLPEKNVPDRSLLDGLNAANTFLGRLEELSDERSSAAGEQ